MDSEYNIVISGLTAAGKTTHSLLLSKALGFAYVSASQIMAQFAGYTVDSATESWWDKLGDALEAERESGLLDQTLDAEMCHRAAESHAQVFDAWALPWTSSDSMLRIWLQSSRESRTLKCAVSLLPTTYPLEKCQRIVDEKDAHSRQMFQRLHGFDLFTDHHIFDFIVDSSELIGEPTPESAAEGIARLDPVLCSLSHWWLVRHSDAGLAQEHKESFWRAASGLPVGAILKLPAALEAAV